MRVFNLLKNIAKSHEVWLLSFVSNDEERSGVNELEKICYKVHVIEKPQLGAMARPLDFFRFLFSGIPPDLRLHEVPAMKHAIHEIIEDHDIDIVEIVDSYMARYIEDIPPESQVKTAITFIDVVFSKYYRMMRKEKKLLRKIRLGLHSLMMRYWEPKYVKQFDRCITVSPVDKDLLLTKNPDLEIDVIPNGVDAQGTPVLSLTESSQSLIYVGNMGYLPNIDAVNFFTKQVMPTIREARPDIHLWIVGINPSDEVKKLAGGDVHVTGRVDQLEPYYSRSRIVVVPLRAGGGTRLKILEAMAFGRPVISTSTGAEGIEVEDGKHLLLANSSQEFVTQTLRLLDDLELQNSLVKNARQLVEEKYDWQVISNQLMNAYKSIQVA